MPASQRDAKSWSGQLKPCRCTAPLQSPAAASQVSAAQCFQTEVSSLFGLLDTLPHLHASLLRAAMPRPASDSKCFLGGPHGCGIHCLLAARIKGLGQIHLKAPPEASSPPGLLDTVPPLHASPLRTAMAQPAS